MSCGCGDFAVLFLERIRARGFATLFVDSAQLSLPSLAHTFSGHAVVALRPADAPSAPWWLVDPTARQVLSRDWPTDAKTFTSGGRDYWIGNCGPLERYPVRSSRELKQFYAATLATVPSEIFNRALPRFVFTIDPLLEDGRGAHLNPRVLRLPSLQDELFGRYRIVPDREIAIHLTRGSDDAMTHLKNVEGRWIAHLGLRSACSASLLDYFAAKTRRGARWNFEHPIVRGCERERVALPAVDLPALATPSPGFLRDTTRAGRRKNPT